MKIYKNIFYSKDFFKLLLQIIFACMLFRKGAASLSPQDALDFLNQFNIQSLLQRQIFVQTNPVAQRELYTLPTLSLGKGDSASKVSCTLFYNGTPYGVFFNNNTPTLTAAMDVSSFSLTGVSDIFDEMFSSPPFSVVNFPVIGDLFDDIIVQSHRLGAMLQYNTKIGNYCIVARVPLLYQLQNVYLTPETQDRFSRELSLPFVSMGYAAKRDEVEEFVLEHFVTDRIGIGDLQIILGKEYALHKNTFTPALEIVAPLDLTCKKGLLGGDFEGISDVFPPFSLYKIVDLANDGITGGGSDPSGSAFKYFYPVFTDMLKRMTASLYDLPLGQKHVSLGLTTTFEAVVNNYQCLGCFVRGMYQLPRETKRFVSLTTSEDSFKRDYNDATQALSNLEFLSTQLLSRMLLMPCLVKRIPGLQLQGQLYTRISSSDIQLSLGCDAWFQQGEKIHLKLSAQQMSDNFQSSLLTVQPSAGQLKVFGSAEKFFSLWDYEFSLALRGDCTLASFGIGKDITLGFSFSSLF